MKWILIFTMMYGYVNHISFNSETVCKNALTWIQENGHIRKAICIADPDHH